MIATAWNNGSHRASGAGYGLKISRAERDRHFSKTWQEVAVLLPGREAPVTVRISPSFWRDCTELRHQEIGRWLRNNGFAPWPKGRPPAFEMEHIDGSTFRIRTKHK